MCNAARIPHRRVAISSVCALLCGLATASAQSASYQVCSDDGGAALGSALANCGDVDGDGRADWCVGAPLVNTAGSASLRSGKDGSALWTVNADSIGDQLGCALAALGDVDGDGRSDVAIGAWLDDPAGVNSGRVRVVSGATGVALHDFAGLVAHEHAGQSVAALGDVDLDGVPDLALGAPGSGKVRVHSGASGALLATASGSASAGYAFALCGVGDLDQDGAGDFAVGAPYFDGSLDDAGRVFVYSGATATPLWSSTGVLAHASHGAALASLGDLDGDATPDLGIGAPGIGAVTVCSGDGGAILWVNDDDGLSGSALASIGDWNADGTSDVAIGDPTAVGSVRLVSGVDGAPLSELLGVGGALSIEAFGSAVGASGDFDADGTIDFVVGAPQANVVAPGAGRAVVYTHVGAVPTPTPLVLAVDGPQLGFSSEAPYVGSIGDLDGDGRADLVVGAPTDELAGFNDQGRVQVRSSATGALLAQHLGVAAGARLGAAVAGVGDVDLDGVPDYAAGSPREDGPADDAGALRVWSGATHALLHEFHGANEDAVLGSAVTGVGDHDGDGFADFAIGAPQQESTGSTFGTAYVHVRSGRTGAVLLALQGTQPGDRFGAALAGVGDVNGDLVPELAIGAWGDDSQSNSNGKALLVSGASGTPLHVHYGSYGAQVGHAVARVGDLDGDGVQDWAANSAGAVLQQVVVFSGASGATLLVLPSSKSSTAFARGLSAAGDVDGDARDDVLVGEAFFGSNQGALHVFSAVGGPPLVSFVPPNAKAFGQSVAALGDLDGDGVSELASAAASTPTQPWRVLVCSGAPHALGAAPIALSVATGGKQSFALAAGATHAGHVYVLVGSLSGTTPGIALGAFTLPLNFDAYLSATASAPNAPPLAASLGVLGASGGGAASFTLPASSPASLAGIHAHHAFVALDATGIAFVSNAALLELRP